MELTDSIATRIGLRFDRAGSRVGVSASARHLFFLLSTVAAVMLIGYHFGTFDQAVHIPFLAKYADPSLYPNDPFLEMRFQHYSFFWFLFLPFQQLHILEPAMLAAHFVLTYCTFWAIWDLSQELFHNTLTSFVAVIALIFPHLTFGGFPLIEFSLLNRTAALPFLLWAIVLGLRGRTTAMFMLLGILFNFHIISVGFILAMVGLDLLDRRQWKALALGGVVFVVFAAPVLVWRALDHVPMGLAPDPAWFTVVTQAILSNLFYLFAPQPAILIATFSGIACFGLWLIARRGVASEHNRSVACYMVAAAGLIVLQVVSVAVFPATFLMQLQIVRAGIPASIFAYIYFAHFLVSRVRWRMLIIALVVSPSAILPAVIWLLRGKASRPRRFDTLATTVSVVLAIGSFAGAWAAGLWLPGVYPYGLDSDWRNVALWARDNTPQSATFIAPPEHMGPYTSDWRAFSQRPTVALLSDVLEIALVPSGLHTWQERFEAIAPGAEAQFRGNYFDNVAITKQAYASLTQAQIEAIAQRYGATYLVSEKPKTYPYPVVYENAGYIIYKLDTPQASVSQGSR